MSEEINGAYDWQKKVIEMTNNHRVVGVVAANQSGKSELGCTIAAYHAVGLYPDWWEGRKYDRPVKIMVAGVDNYHNKHVIQDKLLGSSNWRLKEERGTGMIHKDHVIEESAVTFRGDDLSTIKIKHVSGGMSEIVFRSYSQGREAAQGLQADVVIIDEQPQDDFLYEALVSTAATKGHVICSFTPVLDMTDLLEKLMTLKPLDDCPEDKFGPKYRSQDGWAMVRATWEDITHISEEDKLQLRNGFTVDEANARTYAIQTTNGGWELRKGVNIYDLARQGDVNKLAKRIEELEARLDDNDRKLKILRRAMGGK